MSPNIPFIQNPPPPPEIINMVIDNFGNTYLHKLCLEGAGPEIIRKAVLAGADMTRANHDNMLPIGLAILKDNAPSISALIELGSPLYQKLPYDRVFNATFLAIGRKHRRDILEIILKGGGDIHVNKSGVNEKGRIEDLSCLHMAVVSQNVEALKPLLKAGALLEQGAGPLNLTPLMLAARLNLSLCAKILLESGASVHTIDPLTGFTALHFAALEGRTAVIPILLQHGADINARSKKSAGKTPLMLAAEKGNYETVEILLQRGADPTLTDAFNKTASIIARQNNFSSLHLILQDIEHEMYKKSAEEFFRKNGFKK